ncbi:unnamed protein product [Lathyrus sativus]|nr:unnamed protein product [Lathyrus sativus]
MNGNFQNNDRGRRNHIPFVGFDPGQFNYNYPIPHYWRPFNYNYQIPHQNPANFPDIRHLPRQMPVHYVDNRHLPHHMLAHYVDNRLLPHHMLAHYVDNRHLPHQVPTYYYNPRHLTHQRPQHYADNRPLPRQRPKNLADKKQIPQQMPECSADKKQIPQQMPECSADKKQIPQQTAERCADTRCLPHQAVEEYADKTCLPHQTPEDIAVKSPLPHQKAENDADNTCLPHRKSEHCADMMNLPQQTPEDHTDKKCLPHQPSEHCADMMNLPQQTPEDHTDKRCLPHQPSEHCADLMNLPQKTLEDHTAKKCLPHQMPEPTVPEVATVERVHCKICGVVFPLKKLEAHNNGKKHRRMLFELGEQSTKRETSNEEEGIHIQNSQKSPVVHKKVPKSKKDGYSVENTSYEAPRLEYKEVRAEGSKRKLRDHTGAKDLDFKIENVKNETTSFQKKKVLADESKRSAKDHRSKRETEEAPGVKYMKMSSGIRRSVRNDQPQSTPVKLKASAGSNSSAETECISCDFSATVTPEVLVSSQESTPPPSVESSFEPLCQINLQTEVEEGKEHLEVENCGVETNDQPHSISMEFHAPADSDINTLIEDTCSDFGAIVLVPPQSPIAVQVPTPVDIIQTEMSESKVHNEVQNDIVDSNDQPCLISTELHDPAGSMTNNQTEIVNCDSAAIEIVIEPLATVLPDAVGSSFEPMTECGLHTETEPQVSEAVAYIESEPPTEELDIEIHAASEVSVETETEDGGSQAEVEMDVLAGALGRIHLPQVSVCLTCGDEGFEEAIVYCSKCGDYAMHRYCLKGPVVFTDDVIWFCEDCDEEVLGADYPDSKAADSEKCEVDSIEKCATFVDPQPIGDPIWRGSLHVSNKNFDKVTRLMGHLSTLACPKVLEETRHLPNVLYGDSVQRSAVWPESFKKFGTDNLSIGLYFFPQNERVERYYDQLVDEMISNDLAIRVCVEKAELLIFSSTKLPSQYKRFQSKYYLWGMFKRKQEPLV